MAKVRSKNSQPEILVRKFLHKNRCRYRLHDKNLPGCPDIKLTKYRVVIMVNGCFWHGHDKCRIYQMPKTNALFWSTKIELNKKRDKKNIDILKVLGWTPIVIWECDLKPSKQEKTLNYLLRKIAKTKITRV